MADNYLEYHREEYEIRKARWQARQKTRIYKKTNRALRVERPEDESL